MAKNALASSELPPTILHFESAQTWNGRRADNKLHMIAREVAWRLKGMADVVCGLGLRNRADGGHNLERYIFLVGTIRDLAIELERAHQATWAASEAEEAAELRKSRARKKAAKRPQKKPRKVATPATAAPSAPT